MSELLIPHHAVQQVKDYLVNLQNKLCHSFQQLDAQATCIVDNWQHHSGGEGQSNIFSNGAIFEKGGINFSHVYGSQLPPSATVTRPQLAGASFQALGLSLVMHPDNPYIPTSHANLRFFIATPAAAPPLWWFGGGYDLTPYYGFDDDCWHWHQTAHDACIAFGTSVYSHYKRCCDDYFYLKHRQEARGIGGLFFDDLNQWGFARCFAFLQSIGNSYLNAYLPIVVRRQHHLFEAHHKAFQQYRRGRYVEFNLIYDRGTLFGLQSGGRVESILMSLPPVVNWTYNWQPESGSEEARLYSDYLRPRDWIAAVP